MLARSLSKAKVAGPDFREGLCFVLCLKKVYIYENKTQKRDNLMFNLQMLLNLNINITLKSNSGWCFRSRGIYTLLLVLGIQVDECMCKLRDLLLFYFSRSILWLPRSYF